MSNRRVVLGLGTAAGALFGAALLSGVASPVAFADTADLTVTPDTYVAEAIPNSDTTDLALLGLPSNPFTVDTTPALGGLGSDTVSQEVILNFDSTTQSFDTTGLVPDSTGAINPDANFGEAVATINTYTTPLFTDTSTDISGEGALAGLSGTTDDTFWIAIGGTDLLGFETNPMEILTPFGDFAI